jgi:hypothetical protein
MNERRVVMNEIRDHRARSTYLRDLAICVILCGSFLLGCLTFGV